MADTAQAIAFVIGLEDDKKTPGSITQLRGDKGGRTRLGIAERFHPQLSERGFYAGDLIDGSTNPIRWRPTTISEADAEGIAQETYEKEYASPLAIDRIADQDVANRILSFGVNEGVHQAAVIVQRCCPGLIADGSIGDKTVAAVNAIAPAVMIGRLKTQELAFYKTLAAANPELAQYANGLEARAEA